ncbi:hypothetical protein AYI70_g1182 [Smittium culicis]|uniref:Uncharacterized protein n=1 Tax=Smittium culicis TaxID=133412 RepID=A0A1R1YDZ9_9FUNG|nr:hypothetical protein AYI70_g1182 [Smittium culicis]
MKPNNKSFGFKNVEPARNSSVFLPHIPGKNYEKPGSFDDVSIFDTLLFDDPASSDGDEFCFNVADDESDFESVPAASTDTAASETASVANTAGTEADTAASSSSALPSSAESASSESASSESASSESASSESASAESASAVSASAVSDPASCASVSSASASSVAVFLASAQSSSASSSCNKRKRGPEPKSIGQLVPGPSYCATKKNPVKRPLSSRLSVITYPTKSYKKPWQPKQVPLAASGSSGGPTSGPIANVSAAIACSSFTPTEYAKKVKALELLTGQRDVSVNPFAKSL